jgi:2-polyprenyl-6-hydroxyphenyl methylase/3-demethylubiquinone-9 3-methyltransferase
MKTASSIDPREVAYYERLAHTWWDRHGPLWPIHTLNTLRVRYLERQIAAHFGIGVRDRARFAGLRVLDIGCGGGVLSEALARLGAEVTGIDVAERNIRVARHHAATSDLDIDYRLGSAEELAAPGGRFDVVLNMEVVEHVADLDTFMAACSVQVRPGGMMFIATINRNPLSWLTAVLGAEYILRWLPRGTHHWRKLRRPQEIEALLARGRLQVTDRAGVLVNPFTKQMRLSRFTGINYMLAAVKAAEVCAISDLVSSRVPASRQATAR